MKIYTRKGQVEGAAVFLVNGYSISWTTLSMPQSIAIFVSESSTDALATFPGTPHGFIEAVEWAEHADIDIGVGS